MTELQVGFVFNLLTKPPPQKSSYVLTSLMAQSANARLRVEENELRMGHSGWSYLGLPNISPSTCLRTRQAQRWLESLYKIQSTFKTIPSWTEHLQVKSMGLFCHWLCLTLYEVIPGKAGKKLWCTKIHNWLLKIYNVLLPGLFSETTLMS